jgi:hypothetical protein
LDFVANRKTSSLLPLKIQPLFFSQQQVMLSTMYSKNATCNNKKRQVLLQFDAYLHTQDCKVWQAGSEVVTFQTNILPPCSAQTLQHGSNILLHKLPLNFTASLPGRYKSPQSLP